MAKTIQHDQDKNIPIALFAYRSAIHESTGFTPFMLDFRRTPTLPVDIMLGTPLSLPKSHSLPEFVATMCQRMSTVFSSVRENVKSAQGRQKQVYNRGSRASTYDIDDRVWLYVPAVRVGSTKKFASLWRGPYTVIDKTSPVNYKTQLIGGYQQKPSQVVLW